VQRNYNKFQKKNIAKKSLYFAGKTPVFLGHTKCNKDVRVFWYTIMR
jgi:hypothetical protein